MVMYYLIKSKYLISTVESYIQINHSIQENASWINIGNKYTYTIMSVANHMLGVTIMWRRILRWLTKLCQRKRGPLCASYFQILCRSRAQTKCIYYVKKSNGGMIKFGPWCIPYFLVSRTLETNLPELIAVFSIFRRYFVITHY